MKAVNTRDAQAERIRQAALELLEALKGMVALWDENAHDGETCACVGASPDCPHPPLCELCEARAAIAKAELPEGEVEDDRAPDDLPSEHYNDFMEERHCR